MRISGRMAEAGSVQITSRVIPALLTAFCRDGSGTPSTRLGSPRTRDRPCS